MSFAYLYIFLQSNLLEVPFYFLFFKKNNSFLKILCLTTGINSLTHPIVFFVLMNLKTSYLNTILIAEAFAVTAEMILFCKFLELNLTKSFLGSLTANLASWQFAPMITYWILSHPRH